MTLKRRLADLAGRAAVADRRGGLCPGRGVVTGLTAVRDPVAGPDPDPCPVCDGYHTVVVHEVVVGPGPGGRAIGDDPGGRQTGDDPGG